MTVLTRTEKKIQQISVAEGKELRQIAFAASHPAHTIGVFHTEHGIGFVGFGQW